MPADDGLRGELNGTITGSSKPIRVENDAASMPKEIAITPAPGSTPMMKISEPGDRSSPNKKGQNVVIDRKSIESARVKHNNSALKVEKRKSGSVGSTKSYTSSQGLEKIDTGVVDALFSNFKYGLVKTEKPIDFILSTLDSIKTAFGCHRVTLFPLDKNVYEMCTQNHKLTSVVHTIQF